MGLMLVVYGAIGLWGRGISPRDFLVVVLAAGVAFAGVLFGHQ
jgi:hypothetical protein